MVVVYILLVALITSACYHGEAAVEAGAADNHGGGTTSPLNMVIHTDNLLSSESRMPAYSELAGRVSLIDPDSRREVWHAEAKDYDGGIALPDLSGMALYSDKQFEVISDTARRQFSLNGQYRYLLSAKNAASYVIARSDINGFDLIHSIGEGDWQHTTFYIPWTESSFAPDGSVVYLIDDEGTQIIAFSLYDGRYAVFTQNTVSQFITPTQTCSGADRGGSSTNFYHAVYWLASERALAIGVEFGNVSLLDISAGCQDLSSLTTLSLGSSLATVVHQKQNGDFLVGLDNGDLVLLSKDANAVFQQTKLFNTDCQFLVGLQDLDDGKTITVCESENVGPTTLSRYLETPSVILKYATYDSNGNQLATFSLFKEQSAGTGIDRDTNTMYRALQSSLGELEIIDLDTGGKEIVKGLYLNNLLDEL